MTALTLKSYQQTALDALTAFARAENAIFAEMSNDRDVHGWSDSAGRSEIGQMLFVQPPERLAGELVLVERPSDDY